MAKTETLAGRTTPDTKARLQRMLAALDRRESYIVEKAVERMLDEWEAEQAELGEIAVRRDEAEAGTAKFIPHSDAMAAWKPTKG